MKKCMSCGAELRGKVYHDEMGSHMGCEACGASSDVALLDGLTVMAEWAGVHFDDIHHWSDGSFTVGRNDAVDYYVSESPVHELYVDHTEFTASDGMTYYIFNNGAAPAQKEGAE